ncbi:MAG: hypothetical protein KDD35_06205, partial [Bdellovibrionales bacterium]|nr:hypothetical protein [Bdellovibrionales bacterium]
PEDVRYFREGPGCEKCTKMINGGVIMKGTVGLVPIFELLVMHPEIQEAINRKDSRTEVRERARKLGMLTLAEEALMRVYQGYIDLDSVYGSIFSSND